MFCALLFSFRILSEDLRLAVEVVLDLMRVVVLDLVILVLDLVGVGVRQLEILVPLRFFLVDWVKEVLL
jgi:hypothetical protein|tara:strand:+ start:1138 stop:1344 length:207 start_codon:yes stop_codon:yes gene_type:complete